MLLIYMIRQLMMSSCTVNLKAHIIDGWRSIKSMSDRSYDMEIKASIPKQYIVNS